jgi:hypothetical protein
MKEETTNKILAKNIIGRHLMEATDAARRLGLL